jgi:hypothetical protein
MGAGKWKSEHSEFLRGADVVILPDNDEPGHNHADAVGASLKGIAAAVRVLKLPGLAAKGDIMDFAKAGGTVEELHHLIAREAKSWKPADLTACFSFLGDAPAAPPRELIKNHLPASGVAITGGQSSAGKTFISIYKAVCLATAMPYFGHKIVERVGTAYIAAEGRGLINNRFAAALAKLTITEKLPIAWIKQLPDFASPDGIKLFIRQIKALDEQFRGDFGLRLGHITLDTVAASFVAGCRCGTPDGSRRRTDGKRRARSEARRTQRNACRRARGSYRKAKDRAHGSRNRMPK